MYTIPLVIFILLLTAVINIYITKTNSDQLDNYKDTVREQHSEEEWNQISSIINLSFVASKQNSKFLAQKVEVGLLKEYKDIEVLQQEFEQDMFSIRFYDVLKKNLLLQNSSASSLYPVPYNTMVGMESGIIGLFSNEATTKIKYPLDEDRVSWESYIVRNPNPQLAKAAVKAIKQREDSLIFVQSEATEDGQLEKNGLLTINTLKRAYLKYGVEGLAYYSLLSPSYITENGDIFNTDDRTFMKQNPNYKLILVQTISLADVLSKYENTILTSEKNSEYNNDFLTEFDRFKNIQSIIWSFLLFVICIALINIYNTGEYIGRKTDEEHLKTEGDDIRQKKE